MKTHFYKNLLEFRPKQIKKRYEGTVLKAQLGFVFTVLARKKQLNI